MYSDTDSIIYRHMDGMYNPSLREFVWGITEELGGRYITEYVSNGPKNYAYRSGDGIHVVMVKSFTLNCVASQQLTVDVMKEMAISEKEEHIIVNELRKIRKHLESVKLTHCHPQSCIREFSTRECATLTTTPVYIYILFSCAIREQHSVCECGSYWYFVSLFNLLHFTCDIIY